jgi:hypothetical protein
MANQMYVANFDTEEEMMAYYEDLAAQYWFAILRYPGEIRPGIFLAVILSERIVQTAFLVIILEITTQTQYNAY